MDLNIGKIGLWGKTIVPSKIAAKKLCIDVTQDLPKTQDTKDFEAIINPEAKVSLRRLGLEKNPLLIIDDVLANAEALVDIAAKSQFGAPDDTYYPGFNAPLPRAYFEVLLCTLRPSFERAFGIGGDTALIAHGFFALATTPFEDFTPYQKIPHYDQMHSDHLACVHYLNHQETQGTGFFRHKATGFESINPTRRDLYLDLIRSELMESEPLLTQFCGLQTPNFEMIDQVDMVFNRMLIYPSHVLHCALFADVDLNADPRVGRLTANTFYRPRDT